MTAFSNGTSGAEVYAFAEDELAPAGHAEDRIRRTSERTSPASPRPERHGRPTLDLDVVAEQVAQRAVVDGKAGVEAADVQFVAERANRWVASPHKWMLFGPPSLKVSSSLRWCGMTQSRKTSTESSATLSSA